MKQKILVIDDNEQDLKIIQRFLNKAGYNEIVTAESGEEGIEKVKLEKPNIVILDTVLPGLNGFETCRKIRESMGKNAPKIIIVTGSIDAVDAGKAREAEADEYVVKTSDCSFILEAVKKVI